MVLAHMDEKWLYAVRTRSNCKVLTSIGLEPFDYYAHHKNHIGKDMYIVVTAYVLRDGNDIRRGGKAIPISLVRVGKMVKAKKDSYKRVYKENGSYHYPKLQANLLRKKGELYFASFKLTGSKDGTEKKPKISLLKVYQEQIVPDFEEKVVRKFSNNGTRKVVIVKQEDGAGLHQDRTYLREMNKIFSDRGWLIFNQPSQSPITNVHDACIFPMMSKAVSTVQGLEYGSRLLKGEQLYQTVKSVWENPSNYAAMARAFAGHSQIVLSILHHKGDNNYLSEKGGLSFGIRRTFVTDAEGNGIIPVTLAATNHGETIQGEFLNERLVRKLKYDAPVMRSLDKGKLTKEMYNFLDENMDRTLMSSDLNDTWQRLDYEAETDSEVESEEEEDGNETESETDSVIEYQFE